MGRGTGGDDVSDDRQSYHTLNVGKVSTVVPMSAEAYADAMALQQAIRRWMAATPEQRAEWTREAEEQRRAERADTERVELTLDGLLDRLGWSRAYGEHLVQPYCECHDGMDGWDRCQHARDLDLGPGDEYE